MGEGCRGWWEMKETANEYRVSFWSDEYFLKLIAGIVAQFYNYTENH